MQRWAAAMVFAGCATASNDYARVVRAVEPPNAGGVIGYVGETGAAKAEELARQVCRGGEFDLLETNVVETVMGADSNAAARSMGGTTFGRSSTRLRSKQETQATFRCR